MTPFEKGLFLSFQKIRIEIGSTKLWQAATCKTELSIKRGRGGVVVEHLSIAMTLVPLIQCQHFL